MQSEFFFQISKLEGNLKVVERRREESDRGGAAAAGEAGERGPGGVQVRLWFELFSV